jgi:magnesium transporter
MAQVPPHVAFAPPFHAATTTLAPSVRIWAMRGQDFLHNVPLADLPALLADPQVYVWIDTCGTDNAEAERIARELFRFHPITLEDCFQVREHPKLEVFQDYLFVITHGIAAGSTAVAAETIELDVFLGKRYLFTYHEHPSRAVAAAREVVERNNGGPLRRGPAPLLHEILDRQVDNMEPLLDDVEERIQQLEDRVLVKTRDTDLSFLLALKRTTLQQRRWMVKQREVMMRLARNEVALVPPAEAVMFRDIYDHLNRMTDMLDSDREMLTSLHETYLSITNLRLGEIMKFLTLFTAVLMPLTVITGIYGMNFEFMPELHWRWGYPVVLGLMVTVAFGVIGFFRRRGWVGKDRLGGSS